MVKLRLTRMGAKKNPFYRIVATDSRKARDGQYIEQIGIYDPVSDPKVVRIDADLAKKWLAKRCATHRDRPQPFQAAGHSVR